MRLTPDLVLEGDQGLNCLGDRELVLRNLAIPVIENLALANDSFDVIDLTSNMITVLGEGFPPFPRLRTLYLGNNRIERIDQAFATSLPNLTTLILTTNRLSSIQQLNLPALSKLKNLEVLSILDNHVANAPRIREILITSLPSLKVLNFSKISSQEREALSKTEKPNQLNTPSLNGRKRKRLTSEVYLAKSNSEKMNIGQSNETGVQKPRKKPRKLTVDEASKVRAFIENAKSIEEINRVQEALRNGTINRLLESTRTLTPTVPEPS